MFLKNYRAEDLKKDIPAGIIVALVSIPISIGYSLIAGLPAVYGLYGSLFPILIYGFLTTSPRFVFGVDAAPAALVGGFLVSMGVTPQSPEAQRLVPVITLLTALWLIVFRLIGMGKFVKFISSPVMGGFISGICCEIILMQIPKLFGGDAVQGELIELLKGIWEEASAGIDLLALALGAGTIAVIMVCRRLIPKVPMSVVMMFVGAAITAVFHIERYGVKLLPEVRSGLPHLVLPDLGVMSGHVQYLILSSLTVALVILAETLLATNNYAMKYGDKINNNREIVAYAAGNLAAAFTGCCPVNGSVSRTGIADQFGVRTQMMSVSAAVTMMLILLFGTGFIGLLPVPILTGIVISALLGSLEFDLAAKLRKVDRTEWKIFYVVFFTVLLFGTIYGVLVGIVLSFVTVIIRASDPPRTRLGYIPEKNAFFPLDRTTGAREIRNVLIYRFSGSLFFANAGTFQDEIEDALAEDDSINTVIIDASGMASVDVTASERLLAMYESLKDRGIRFFLTEHQGEVNDQLRAFGAGEMFRDGAIRPKITQALAASGIRRPYELKECTDDQCWIATSAAVNSSEIAEFEWAFGDDADEKMQELAESITARIAEGGKVSDEVIANAEKRFFGSSLNDLDEEKFLDFLELQLAAFYRTGRIKKENYDAAKETLAAYHAELDDKIGERSTDLMDRVIRKRMEREKMFRERYPEFFRAFEDEREEHRHRLMEMHPDLVEKIGQLRKDGHALIGDLRRAAQERDDGAAGGENPPADEKPSDAPGTAHRGDD